MLLKILGSAAGGGFPQWNCLCPNCRALRAGTFDGKARSQTQVAISADGRTWSCSEPLPIFALKSNPLPNFTRNRRLPKSPRLAHRRRRPVNADLDHTLGLLLLRELQPLHVYATDIRSPHPHRRQLHVRHAPTRPRPTHVVDLHAHLNLLSAAPAGEDSRLRCRPRTRHPLSRLRFRRPVNPHSLPTKRP